MLIVKGIRKLPKMPRGFPTVLVPGNGKGKCMLVTADASFPISRKVAEILIASGVPYGN